MKKVGNVTPVSVMTQLSYPPSGHGVGIRSRWITISENACRMGKKCRFVVVPVMVALLLLISIVFINNDGAQMLPQGQKDLGIEDQVSQLLAGDPKGEIMESLLKVGALAARLDVHDKKKTLVLLSVLQEMGPHGVSVVPEVVQLIERCDLEIKPYAYTCLARMTPFMSRTKGQRLSKKIYQELHLMHDEMAEVTFVKQCLIARWMAYRQNSYKGSFIRRRVTIDIHCSIQNLKKRCKVANIGEAHLACELLGWKGAEAKEAIPLLERYMERHPGPFGGNWIRGIKGKAIHVTKHHDNTGRVAARSILKICGEEQAPISAHCVLLIYGLRYEKWNAIRALRNYEEVDTGTAKAVLQLLKEEQDADLRVEALTTLEVFGPRAREAIPFLKNLSKGEDERLAAQAKAALIPIIGEPNSK